MPAPDRDPRDWTGDRYGHHRGHRQRGRLQKGPGICRLVRGGSRGALQRRAAAAYWYQQTWKQIPAKALRLGSTYRAPAEDEAIFGPEYVAGQSQRTQAQAGHDRGLSQQDGTHGLGGSLQRRGSSPAARPTNRRSLNGLHMTPGTSARLGNRFAIPTSAVQRRRI